MNGREAIQRALKSTQRFAGWYVEDLTDDELLVRPVPGANHIAWQLGHLIYAETMMGSQLPGAKYPEVPASEAAFHSKKPSTGTMQRRLR